MKAKKRGPGQPAHVPTPQGKLGVATMIAGGIAQVAIAKWLGISERSLRNHYRKQIDSGGADYIMALVGTMGRFSVGSPAQYDKGNLVREEVKPIYQCTMFALKCRAGWREQGTSPLDGLEAGDTFKFEVSKADAKT